MGRWIRSRGIPRDAIVIIGKGGCGNQDELWRAKIGEASLRAELAGSLSRLGVDKIDCYLLVRLTLFALPQGPNLRYTWASHARSTATTRPCRLRRWSIRWTSSWLRERSAHGESPIGRCLAWLRRCTTLGRRGAHRQ